MWRVMTSGALLLAVMVTGSLQAQTPFALELRGGAGVPTGDLGDATLKPGGGFEFNASYLVAPYVRVYAGWDWQRRVTDQPFAGNNFDVEDTGYVFGLRIQYPFSSMFNGWIRAGGLYDHIELENNAGTIVGDSGHELGWEVGGGFQFPLGSSFALTPGVRYRSLSTDLNGGGGVVPVDLTYLTVEAGIVWFPGAAR